MIRLITGLVVIVLVQTIHLNLAISQPTRELIEVTLSPDNVIIEELIDEVTHLTKVKIKITIKLSEGDKLIVNWTGVERRKNEFYIEVKIYRLKGIQNMSTRVYVEEQEFELGKLEGGMYKVHVTINGKLMKTEILVVPSESGESRIFSPKPGYATILLILIVLVAVLIFVKYFMTR